MQDDHNATALARIDADFSEQGASLRHNLCDFQTLHQKVLSLVASPRQAKKEPRLPLHAFTYNTSDVIRQAKEVENNARE